ncbi:MAG: GNAT family N-acetyltransferase [Firmicutes bacterium HGW-Firmicutes-1]|jgi:ribosomal protein S18 acetylase RimI-like enzyme|nr:MAG: GNAT family N-acetyltransferase [Firmicutes bacterium HGW-Firmicutes-1]
MRNVVENNENNQLKIENVDLKELSIILELQKLCYKENAVRYNDYKIPPMVQTIEELQEEFSHGLILKAVEESKIIGSIRAYEKDNVCYIGRVIVHPNFQNKGIGRRLMNDIESSYPKCSKFELYTGFKDEKNIYFYRKLGYKIFKEELLSDKVKFLFLEKINIVSPEVI